MPDADHMRRAADKLDALEVTYQAPTGWQPVAALLRAVAKEHGRADHPDACRAVGGDPRCRAALVLSDSILRTDRERP